MNPNENPRKPLRRASETTTPPSGGSGASKRKKNPRITPEAHAEVILLQSLALRIGQEAARQNGIETTPYLPIEGDPRGASLARLEVAETGTHEAIKLRATITVEVNPATGAVIGFTPPPRPRR